MNNKKFIIFPILIFLVVISFLIYNIYILFIYIDDSIVSNQIISEYVSPNGKYRAVVFVRDAGATTNRSYQLSILKNGKKLKNQKGNVLITYSDFEVTWVDSQTLKVEIRNKNKDVFKQIEEIDDIKILYTH